MTAAAQVVATPLSALHPAPWNPRQIGDERFQNLCMAVAADPDFLWRRPVLAQADGTIYAGNQRYRAAEHLGMETIPAIVESVPDDLAKERALRDNGSWGEWLDDGLTAILAELRSHEFDVTTLGLNPDALSALLTPDPVSGEAPDAWEQWDDAAPYEQNDLMPCRQVIMSFRTEDDVAEFCRRLDLTLTPKSKSSWFPREPRRRPGGVVVGDEQAPPDEPTDG